MRAKTRDSFSTERLREFSERLQARCVNVNHGLGVEDEPYHRVACPADCFTNPAGDVASICEEEAVIQAINDDTGRDPG